MIGSCARAALHCAFYEWQKTGAGKQPYAIVGADGLPLALAGLWERWKQPENGEAVHAFTIVTTAPNELVAPIHDRMPVILPREKWAAWLGEREADSVDDPPAVPGQLDARYPVDLRVGNVKNNEAALLDEISVAA